MSRLIDLLNRAERARRELGNKNCHQVAGADVEHQEDADLQAAAEQALTETTLARERADAERIVQARAAEEAAERIQEEQAARAAEQAWFRAQVEARALEEAEQAWFQAEAKALEQAEHKAAVEPVLAAAAQPQSRARKDAAEQPKAPTTRRQRMSRRGRSRRRG